MKNAAIGFRVHSGWTALVVVSLEKHAPIVLSRQRLQLVKTFTYKYRQPYHTAERMHGNEAAEFVSQVRAEAQDIAASALKSIQVQLKNTGIQLACGALRLASGRALPEFEKILASHALIHTADGELFRDVLRHTSSRANFELREFKERDLLRSAAKILSFPSARLLRKLTQLGKPFGAPWTQDEKFAALAAWLVLLET